MINIKQLVQELDNAIMDTEFQLYYQPIVSLMQKKVAGFECLIRWHHPQYGDISPELFIPLCEEHKKIEMLGRWALKHACLQLQQWQKNLPVDIYLTVNVSTQQLTAELAPYVDNLLKAYQLSPRQLTIEITETAAIEDIDLAKKVIMALRQLGCDVLLDDFATANASFDWLRKLPVNGFKISYDYTRYLLVNPMEQAIVRSLLQLGHALSLKVVIEGVETREQLDWLTQQNVNFIQGNYFHKALSVDKVMDYLQQEYS